jgi:hypothetical protein
MPRFMKSVVWFPILCFLGFPVLCVMAYLTVGMLVVPAPGIAQAQPPADGHAPPPVPAATLEPVVNGIVVIYPFKTSNRRTHARWLQEQYAGRANVQLDDRAETAQKGPTLIVRAPADVHQEIRGVVNFLTGQRSEPTSTPTDDQPVQPDSTQPLDLGGNPAATTVPQPGLPSRIVVYTLRHASPRKVADIIDSQFSGRVKPITADDRTRQVLIAADRDTHTEIRGVIKYLDRAAPSFSSGAGDRAMMGMAAPQQVTQHGYLGIAQQQQQAAQERIRAARQAMADAKSDEEKKAARTQLRQLLADVFAQDMQTRDKQAAEIESRLSKLRQQYHDRQAAKDKIIDLQLKVIEADAAGLGFPGGDSSRPTPPSSIRRSANPFGNRKQVGAETQDDPMIRSGLPSRNVPARRVDEHDPIPTERTLEEVKKTHAAVVATLKERGHFIESKDGKLYAYANVNYPSGPSHIRVVDSTTGKLVATGTINSVARPLVFTEDGVATRESFNIPSLRVPLNKRSGPKGDVFEPGSANRSRFDPMAAALDPGFLKQHSANRQTRVGELSARGHFVGSPDGKLYAYVETGGEGVPEGTAEIRVCDVRTGQRLAAVRIKSPVGKLKFFNEGVATEEVDGTVKLRLSLSAGHDTQEVLETTRPAPADARPAEPAALVGPSLSQSEFTSEFNALRDQYRKAKFWLVRAESRFNALVAEAQTQTPNASVDDVKKQQPDAWQAVELARPDFETAHRLLETKLEFLDLDRKSAKLAFETAEAKLRELTELHTRNAASFSEVNQQRAALEAADLNVERIGRLIHLFASIRSEPTPTSDAQPAGARNRADDRGDPVSLSETLRGEALAMLQGDWNCVAADSNDKQLSKDELAALALRFAIQGDEVTISYYGDDLKQHETAGKLLIDMSTSPPSFHIDIHVAGIQAPSRLSGQTRIDRGALRMHRPGGTFLVHRTFESEPSAFEFKRPRSDSAQGDSSSALDRIKSLGLKLGNEMKTSLDTRHPMRIAGKDGEVTISAGETKLIELPEPTLMMQWKCGDHKPEGIEDVEPFDYVLVEWKADGHVTWSCYRSPGASTPLVNRATRIPGENTAEMVTVRDMLALKPEVANIDYDQPTESEIDACRVALEPGSAWSLLSRDGMLLRRFEDTNRDGVVDSWRYYKAGKFVYRDVDSDHDRRVDRHDRPEPPRTVR